MESQSLLIRKIQHTLPIIGEFANNVTEEEDIKSLFKQHLGGLPLDPTVELKLQNTIDYIRFIKDTHEKNF